MRRLLSLHLLTAALVAAALFLPFAQPLRAQTVIQPSDVTYEGTHSVATNGSNSAYSQGLTHRYVNGEQRLLLVSPQAGAIDEFTIEGRTFGSGQVTVRTGRWTVPSGTLDNFNGIWWEEAKQRLWVTGATDYFASGFQNSHITLLSLPATGGAATLIGRWSISGINAKRVYGACRSVPAWAQANVGGPYECGSGGYTSALMGGGGAAIGPTMFAIDEPTDYPTGTALPLRRRVLDVQNSQQARGVRKTFPVNYFDGGDNRPNGTNVTRPTVPPLPGAGWLSPNANGLGWMTWGDSYYNTGMWVDTPTLRGFVLIGSLCKGSCWYQASTLAFDARQFEIHVWDPATLGTNVLARPTFLGELVGPAWGSAQHLGNQTLENVSGATFDAVTGRMYLSNCGSMNRPGCDIHVFRAGSGGGTPPPPPPPADTDGDGVVDSADACPTVAGTQPNGCPTPAADTTPPSVSITAPLEGADVSGSVTVSATASDNVGVQSVQFSVDGVDFGVADTSVAYARVWSAGSTPGTHVLRAVARDAAGNVTTSAGVTVTVAGGATPPPPPPADTDGDGVVDTADACPTVAGALPNGCLPAPTPEPEPEPTPEPVPVPDPTPEPDEMYEQLISLLKSIEASVKARELKGCRVTSTTLYTITISRDCGIARPANGQILKVGE